MDDLVDEAAGCEVHLRGCAGVWGAGAAEAQDHVDGGFFVDTVVVEVAGVWCEGQYALEGCVVGWVGAGLTFELLPGVDQTHVLRGYTRSFTDTQLEVGDGLQVGDVERLGCAVELLEEDLHGLTGKGSWTGKFVRSDFDLDTGCSLLARDLRFD